MAEYVKKSDVIKIMENNSHMIEVFGVKKKMIDGFAMCCDFADLETVDIDEDDLEKQIPEKPKNVKSIFDFSGRYYTTKGDCPCCGAKGLFRSISYCYSCGQKLDWGGSEKP